MPTGKRKRAETLPVPKHQLDSFAVGVIAALHWVYLSQREIADSAVLTKPDGTGISFGVVGSTLRRLAKEQAQEECVAAEGTHHNGAGDLRDSLPSRVHVWQSLMPAMHFDRDSCDLWASKKGEVALL